MLVQVKEGSTVETNAFHLHTSGTPFCAGKFPPRRNWPVGTWDPLHSVSKYKSPYRNAWQRTLYSSLNNSLLICAIRTKRKHYFTLNLFLYLKSTCFEQAYFSLSGGTFLNIQQLICVMLLCWLAASILLVRTALIYHDARSIKHFKSCYYIRTLLLKLKASYLLKWINELH